MPVAMVNVPSARVLPAAQTSWLAENAEVADRAKARAAVASSFIQTSPSIVFGFRFVRAWGIVQCADRLGREAVSAAIATSAGTLASKGIMLCALTTLRSVKTVSANPHLQNNGYLVGMAEFAQPITQSMISDPNNELPVFLRRGSNSQLLGGYRIRTPFLAIRQAIRVHSSLFCQTNCRALRALTAGASSTQLSTSYTTD